MTTWMEEGEGEKWPSLLVQHLGVKKNWVRRGGHAERGKDDKNKTLGKVETPNVQNRHIGIYVRKQK